jgi:lipoprotein-releasing system ATP-binding protein
MSNSNMAQAAVLQAHHLSKVYGEGAHTVQVLNDVSIAVKPAEKLAIIGASGS